MKEKVASGWWLAGRKLFVVGCSLLVTNNKERATSNRLRLFRPTAYSLRPTASRYAFTLTEVLVVITILAVLAALGTVGIMRAMDTAKQTRIKVEVDNLDGAFKGYKEKYGSYPPCDLYDDGPTGTRNRVLRAHIARAFPRYNINNLAKDLALTGLDRTTSRPDQALVFWLRGFSSDPSHPFVTWDNKQIITDSTGSTSATVTVKPTSFYEFDTTRLVSLNKPADPSKYLSYIPPGLKQNIPYVYFDPAWLEIPGPLNWDTTKAYDPIKNSYITTGGLAAPYIRDPNGVLGDSDDEMFNAESVQILACGLDHKFGVGSGNPQKVFPTGVNYDPLGTDDDNVTNFCARARIGDDKP